MWNCFKRSDRRIENLNIMIFIKMITFLMKKSNNIQTPQLALLIIFSNIKGEKYQFYTHSEKQGALSNSFYMSLLEQNSDSNS